MSTKPLSQFSLDPFVSMTFTQVEIPTLIGKIINFFTCLEKLVSYIEDYIPVVGGTIVTIFSNVILLCSLVFRAMVPPLMIRIEALNAQGFASQFLLKDNRPWLQRIFDFGEKKLLTSFDDEEKALMKTMAIMRDCCCDPMCVSCCCFSVKQKVLLTMVANGSKSSNKSNVSAKTKEWQCCECDCLASFCSSEITVGEVHVSGTTKDRYKNQEQELTFKKMKKCCPSFAKDDDDKVNQIVLPHGGWSVDDYKMIVKPKQFSWRDFLFEVVEMVMDEYGSDEEEANEPLITVMKEHFDEKKEAYDEIKEAYDKTKEAFDEFKVKGYKEVKTSFSKWKVKFPPEFVHEDKSAVVLFVSESITNGR